MAPEPLRLKELAKAVSLRLPDDVYARTRQYDLPQALQDPAIVEITSKLEAVGLTYQLLVSCGLLLIHASRDRVCAVLGPAVVAPPEPR